MNNISLFSFPVFANLEFKHSGKSYYLNREIVQVQSEFISSNPSIKTVLLPSIKGEIKELINYLYGSSVRITGSNAFFFDIMSFFLQIKDENLQKTVDLFLPKIPTLEMVFQYFKCQEEISIDINSVKYRPYFKFLNKYLTNYENSYISYLSVNFILQNYISLNLSSSKTILKCLLQDLKNIEYQSVRYNEIEKTIIELIKRYPSRELYEILLFCPYFNISKVTKFKEILSQPPNDEKYPFEPGKGYFQTHLNDDNFNVTIQTSSINQSSTTNCFRIQDENEPFFIYKFNDFQFDIESYSFKILKECPHPISWSLYASKDFKNYVLIHHCENGIEFNESNENKVFNFKVEKIVSYAKTVKFVLIKSSKNESNSNENENESNTLCLLNFDIFGTSHNSYTFLSESTIFDDDNDDNDDLVSEEEDDDDDDDDPDYDEDGFLDDLLDDDNDEEEDY